MKTTQIYFPLILAAALGLVPTHSARADEAESQIAFSDPSKPGTLKIRIWHGDISIHGADVKEITVKSDCAPASPTPRKDGMRVLTSSSGFVLSEKENVATLEYGAEGWTGASADFDITVPRTTSITVASTARGDFECTGVSGDVDVRTMSGDVKLEDISGGALVETMNGEIDVRVRELAENRPLSFTSMHGQVSIHVPVDSKANVRFRTHRGVILTNFDDKALVTKTVVSHGKTRGTAKPEKEKDKGKGKAAAGPTVAEPAAGPDTVVVETITKSEEPEKSSEDSDGDWHAEVRDSIRMAADEAAMAAREAAEAVHEGMAQFRVEFNGGAMPPLPPMTGGKVVAGTLNGGGVEIQAATLSGDIIFKKIE